MNRYINFFILFAAAATLVACNKEPNAPGGRNSSSMAFVVGGTTYSTKAGSVAEPVSTINLDLSEESGIQGLTLREEVTSLDDLFFNDAQTKSTPVFTENINSIYSAIAVTAYSGGTQWGKADRAYQYTEDYKGGKVYEYNYSAGSVDSNLAWPDDGKLTFVLKAPVEAAGRSNIEYNATDNEITFHYVSPTAATDQKDILFSSKHVEEKTAYTLDNNRVLLYHALTGVKFKLKNASNQEVTIQTIDKVTLNNLYSEADCIVAPDYEGKSFDLSNPSGQVAKSASVSTWKERKAKKSFSQTFASSEQGVDLTDGDYDYPTSFSGNAANTEGNLNDVNASKTFMFIPQEIGEDVTLTIEYTYKVGTSGESKSGKTTIDFGKKLIASLPEGTTTYEWLAGELRTYTLMLGDKVDVVIDDTVNTTSHTKTGLTIANTGTATSYIRVAAIANWFSDLTDEEKTKGVPVAISVCPEFKALVNGAVNTTDWIKGDDGYYYYKYPVAGGKTITSAHTLFSTLDLSTLYVLKKNGGVKPYVNCHLEVAFPVQAVRAADLREWTSSTAKWDWTAVQAMQLNTTTQD